MAKRGRPTVEITLTGTERRQLESWSRRHSSAQSLALRCRIILACSDPDLSRQEIADQVGCNPATVTKWRNRFAQQRLDGLIDEPRPGAARTIGDDVVEAVVIDTLESAPRDATHWSTRSLAAKHGISHQTVSEIWRAFGLRPWRQDEFKISPDPQLIEKIRDPSCRNECEITELPRRLPRVASSTAATSPSRSTARTFWRCRRLGTRSSSSPCSMARMNAAFRSSHI